MEAFARVINLLTGPHDAPIGALGGREVKLRFKVQARAARKLGFKDGFCEHHLPKVALLPVGQFKNLMKGVEMGLSHADAQLAATTLSKHQFARFMQAHKVGFSSIRNLMELSGPDYTKEEFYAAVRAREAGFTELLAMELGKISLHPIGFYDSHMSSALQARFAGTKYRQAVEARAEGFSDVAAIEIGKYPHLFQEAVRALRSEKMDNPVYQLVMELARLSQEIIDLRSEAEAARDSETFRYCEERGREVVKKYQLAMTKALGCASDAS